MEKKNFESIVRIAAAAATIVTVLAFARKRNKKENECNEEILEGEFVEIED